VINLLAKLIDYEKDPNYFHGTEIKTKENAQKVFDAINNGSLNFTVPMLDLRHTRYPMAIEWGIYAVAGLLTALNTDTTVTFNSTNSTHGEMGIRGVIAIVTALTMHLCTNSTAKAVLGESIQDGIAYFIERGLAPLSGNFDPDHIKPIDAIAVIEGKLSCPILIHYCKSDEVLSHQIEDVEKAFNCLKTNNENKTHLVISPFSESFHNFRESKMYAKKEEWFKEEYGLNE